MPLERWLNRLGALVMPLALLVVLLLFLQWPLRDGWGAGSSQANDLAQVLFALYVAVALRHADRRGAHLVSRPDLAHAGRGPVRAMRLLGAPLAVLPWAVFVCINAAPTVWRSVRGWRVFLKPPTPATSPSSWPCCCWPCCWPCKQRPTCGGPCTPCARPLAHRRTLHESHPMNAIA